MPIKGGFDVLEWIKVRDDITLPPVVILSSSQQISDVKKAYSLGANGFVTKSTTINEMTEEIKLIVGFWLKLNHVAVI
jgi:two-component system response regulator